MGDELTTDATNDRFIWSIYWRLLFISLASSFGLLASVNSMEGVGGGNGQFLEPIEL